MRLGPGTSLMNDSMKSGLRARLCARARAAVLGVLAALCVLAGTAGTAAAQNSKLRLERFGFDKLPDVRVYLTFTEDDGTVIAGRAATDFKLLLDGAEQGAGTNLVTFDQVKEPIYVIGVVQVSSVVSERALSEIKQGMRRINEVVASTAGGRMGLLAYASQTNRLIESGVSSEVDAAIGKLHVEGEDSETHMIDSVRTAIDLLKAQEKGRRKLIVLVSDGIDVNNDKKLFTDIGNRAQQAGIVIDSVGYAEFDPSKLKNLTEMTKRCYGVDRVAKVPTEIGPRLDAIVDEIQKQYVVTFPTIIAGDDKDHTFQVTHEAGGKPVYSGTVNEKLPSKPIGVAVPKEGGKSRLWLWILLGVGALVAIVVIYLLTRKKPQPEEKPAVAAPAPLSAPMPSKGANKTVMLEAAGDIAMGWIMGLTGSYKDQTFKLKDRAVIGTSPDCDIVIQDGFMSGRHCEIRKIDGGFKLVDLGATNGVIVNDRRVKEHFLVDNDNFRLGRTEFKFKSIFS